LGALEKMKKSILNLALRVIFLQFCINFGMYLNLAKAVNPSYPNPSNPTAPNVYDLNQLIGNSNIRNFIERSDNLGSQIPNLIYNSISHYGVNLISTPSFNLNLNFGRDVYDNKSVFGSYTVVDQIGISEGIPLFNSRTLLPGLMNGLNFYIGTNTGIVVNDVRQVSPSNYSKLPSIEDRAKKIVNGDHYQNFLKTMRVNLGKEFEKVQGQWVHFINETGDAVNSFLPNDPESHARYAKIWNMFLTPFRLPLTRAGVAGMEKDEIISYEGQGAVQSGLGTGWNIDPTGLTMALSAGVSVSAFTRGVFRISILKETDSIVKVKVARIGSLGRQWTAGSDAGPGLLDQFVVIRYFTNFFKVLPFQLSQGVEHSSSFEVTYQYDLATQTGTHAYESAVLGNLKPSDEMAITPQGGWRTSLAETGVLRLSDYHGKTQTISTSDTMQLTFLFRQNQSGQVIDTEGVLTSPDGTQRRLTALAQNTKEWNLIFNQFQKYQHNFVVNLDLEKCERDPESCKSFPMQVEGRIDDSDTTQAALLHYILEVEDSVGQQNIFTRSPEIRDLRNFMHDPYHPFYFYHPGHDLGGSHFYYSLNLTPDQVDQFVHYPEDQMWPSLERAFQVSPGSWSTVGSRWMYGLSRAPVTVADLFLNLFQLNWAPGTDLIHADQIWMKWRDIKLASNPVEKAEALAKTFLDPLYSRNMTRLVRGILTDQSVDYYASGNNRVIGSVSREGGTHVGFTDLASQLARSVELKKTPTPEEMDPELQFREFGIQTGTGGDVHLEINTPIVPDSYYVDLTINDWSSFMIKNRLTFAKIFKNPGIAAGKTNLALDPKDTLSEWGELARHLRPNIRYKLRMAISKDGQKWGHVAETDFRLLKF